jgi:WD40 repeat protein
LESKSLRQNLSLWDLDRGVCLHILRGHCGIVTVALTDDARRTVHGSEDMTLRLWDLVKESCSSLPLQQNAYSFAVGVGTNKVQAHFNAAAIDPPSLQMNASHRRG